MNFCLIVQLLWTFWIGTKGLNTYYISTVAGSTIQGIAPDGSVAAGARIASTYGVWVDSVGLVYFTEGGNRKIRTVGSSGTLGTFAGVGLSGGSSPSGGPATSTQLSSPIGIWGCGGTVYFTDTCRIWSVTNGVITFFAGTGGCGYSGDSGKATSGSISNPYGVCGDSVGNIYIGEYGGFRIRKVSVLDSVITTVAGTGSSSSLGDGGPATSATVGYVQAIYVDTVFHIYVTDSAGRIRIITSGVINTMVGTSSNTYSPDGLPATSTNINLRSGGVWVDVDGNLYYSETNVNKVRAVDVTNGKVFTIAGDRTAGTNGNYGIATSANVNTPCGVYGVAATNVYIAEGAYLIRTLTTTVPPTPTPSFAPTFAAPTALPTFMPVVPPSVFAITAFAGNTVSSMYLGDGGPATSAFFNYPQGQVDIFQDTQGITYISDCYSSVRKVSVQGIISTAIGTNFVADDDVILDATSANLDEPGGVWADTIGQVYVALYNNEVRKLGLDGKLRMFAGIKFEYISSGDGGQATAAGVATYCIRGDTVGNVYLGDSSSVRVVASSGIIRTYVGNGNYGPDGDGGPATAAAISYVQGLFMDTAGVLFISDTGIFKVRSISANNIITTLAGTGNNGETSDGLAGTSMMFLTLAGIWSDSQGNVFVVDTERLKIKMISSSRLGYTVAGSGYYAASNSAGLATATSFLDPQGLCGDSTGSLYVTDTFLARKLVRLITPTVTPTVQPSVAPSVSPSQSPSVKPSAAPSAIPSMSPTLTPSVVPTLTPSVLPTMQPSVKPTLAPSIAPSVVPSETPSTSPTAKPSMQPTAPPSVLPTKVPTILPSELPSVNPSPLPTVLPSGEPTVVPSLLPSAIPSLRPSACPSLLPSVLPSKTPSCKPSIVPSKAPTLSPTRIPSVSPINPSRTPSKLPTLKPSGSPSIQPSVSPSEVPSEAPSESPSSLLPTKQPSCDPSEGPTMLPSVLPSHVPSSLPTDVPSILPTVSPSGVPTELPTLLPSFAPTILPSVCPTLVPTTIPTTTPTLQPSDDPTHVPTALPSLGAVPSTIPSVMPTLTRTPLSTHCPSMIPSVASSVIPSLAPTFATPTCPSIKPTLHPTYPVTHSPTGPTLNPTLSIRPSVSMNPTCIPTIIPTAAPTRVPTTKPTAIPTTVEYFTTHPKATLPSNASISVIGPADVAFKIILPFQLMSGGAFGVAFSNIELTSEASFVSYVVQGGSMLSATVTLSKSNTQYSSSGGFDSSKRSVSQLGDVNGDGINDIIIGDPYANKCYVLFGTADGLMELTSGFTIFGETDGDMTGWSVSSAGDVNSDALADIIVGAPRTDDVGAFHVIYGRRLNNFDVYLNNFTASQGFSIFGAQKNDYLGISVSDAGDVNHDGYDDVIAGAVVSVSYYAGAAYLVYGGRDVGSLSSIAQLDTSRGCKLTGVSYMFAGYSVSRAGDVNQDGYDDVIIGTSPARNNLQPSAFIVYGSSVLNDMTLTMMTAPQGVRILGEGATVTSIGDVNQDGFSDVMLGSTVSTEGSTGLIVYSTPSFLVAITDEPSSAPTAISEVPSVKPSRNPTARPSPKISHRPTPVRPTKVPSINATEAPSVSYVPSAEPSTEPSEAPTILPTEEPSDVPTVVPSIQPTYKPSITPSIKPTVIPTTTTPTLYNPSRPPFRLPTLLPTTPVTLPSVVDYFIDDRSDHYNDSKSSLNTRYIVNITKNTEVDSSLGKCIYYIIPNSNWTLTILRFNASEDRIDVSLFPKIRKYSDLAIAAGSVIVTFSSQQLIHILKLEPSDMSEKNFIFTSPPASNEEKHQSHVILALIVVLPIVVVLGVGLLAHWWNARQKKKKIDALAERRCIGSYDTDKNGEYLFHDEVNEVEFTEEVMQEVQELTDSVHLSEHTIDSNGEWRVKEQQLQPLSVVERQSHDSSDSSFNIGDFHSNHSEDDDELVFQDPSSAYFAQQTLPSEVQPQTYEHLAYSQYQYGYENNHLLPNPGDWNSNANFQGYNGFNEWTTNDIEANTRR